MNQDTLKDVLVKTVEFPIEFVNAMFEYFDKLDRPFTEKEGFMNTFREGFKIAQYKEYLRLEAEKAAKTVSAEEEPVLKVVRDQEVND